MNQYWYEALTPIYYSSCLSFYLRSFFCPEISSRTPFTFISLVSLGSSWLWPFLRLKKFFKLFLIIKTLLRNNAQVCRRVCQMDLSDMVFLITLGLLVLWEDHRGQAPFSSHTLTHQGDMLSAISRTYKGWRDGVGQLSLL